MPSHSVGWAQRPRLYYNGGRRDFTRTVGVVGKMVRGSAVGVGEGGGGLL